MKKIIIIFLFIGFQVNIHGNSLDEEYSKEFTDIIEFVYGSEFLSQGGFSSVDMMFDGEYLDGKKVLDIGSGLGGIDFYLAEKYTVNIIGTDRVLRLVEDTNARRKNYRLRGNVSFIHQKTEADLTNFSDESFDIIFAKESLLHVDNNVKEGLLNHFFRILKPGGRLIILDWLIPTSQLGEAIKEMMAIDNLDLKMATLKQYSSFLKNAGFSELYFENKNEDYIKYTDENIQRLEDAKQEFVATFGSENFNYSLKSWGLQRSAFKRNEVEATLLKAVKPKR